MKLLEVIRTPQTSDETFDAMVAWGKAMKKATVAAKDTPGKALPSNRVHFSIYLLRLVVYCKHWIFYSRDRLKALKPFRPALRSLQVYLGYSTLYFLNISRPRDLGAKVQVLNDFRH